MTAPSVTTSFASNTTAFASEVNTNFSDLVSYLSDRNDGSATWDRCLVTSASAVPLIVNNSTGTTNIANFQDNGSNVLTLADGGTLTLSVSGSSSKGLIINNSTSTGNICELQDNGTVCLTAADGGTVTASAVGSSADALICDNRTSTGKIFQAKDNGTTVFQVVDGGNVYVTAAKAIFWDGGGDTSTAESSADVLDSTVGGVLGLSLAEIGTLVNVICGKQAALATNATDGFLYIPSCAGAPTGVPTSYTGKVAMVYDTANEALYVYNGGWVSTTLS